MSLRKLEHRPQEANLKNYMVVRNAYAKQIRDSEGVDAPAISAQNAAAEHERMIRLAVAAAEPKAQKHDVAINSVKEQFDNDREAVDGFVNIGHKFSAEVKAIAANAQKAGMEPEKAVAVAYNSVAGNPVYDHFGNLNVRADQLFAETAFIRAWQENGGMYSLPTEAGGTNQDKSRFRAPVTKLTGSAKVWQGDINPIDHIRNDSNRTQISLYNEFKNAETLFDTFAITQAMRDQALGYQKAVDPALGGFILQNLYSTYSQELIMKLAEGQFTDGLDYAGTYTNGVGGTYGMLSPSILLQGTGWNTAAPSVATASDWASNPSKLMQVITNFNYKPSNVAAQLSSTVDPAEMYKDIIRLFTLFAQQNVAYGSKKWILFVPTTWYSFATQYPQAGDGGQGTFNKQLSEMVATAVGGRVVEQIEVIPSSLMNYRTQFLNNAAIGEYNYMLAVNVGGVAEKQPVIMPGQTSAPYIVSTQVTSEIMTFDAKWIYGGPMFMQYGGAALMQFSLQA